MDHIENFIQDILTKFKELELNNCINLSSAKLNRRIMLEKCEAGCNIHELGVNKRIYNNVSLQELSALLKVLIKMEFSADPRIKVSILKPKDEVSESKETEIGSEK